MRQGEMKFCTCTVDGGALVPGLDRDPGLKNLWLRLLANYRCIFFASYTSKVWF